MQLAEAGYDVTEMAMDNNSSRFAKDENLFVRFFTHPKQDQDKSAAAGRPIFVDTVYITIMVPGDKTSIISRPASQRDKDRFAKHFANFESKAGDVLEGTPLEAWPGISRSQVEEMKYFNVRTVEQLANMSDTNAQKFMGMSIMRTRALAFLEAAEGNAANETLAAELEKRDNEILGLKQAVEELGAKIHAAETATAEE